MKTRQLPTVIACGALLCGAAFAQSQPREAPEAHGTQPFRASVAGVCMNKDDFAFTKAPVLGATGGALRIYCDLIGDSTHGRLTFQAVAEEDFSPASCTLAGGLSGGFQFPLTGYMIVLTFTTEQDQLYLSLISGSECGNPAITPIGIGQATLKVLGGTGRFVGASGMLSHSWSDVTLALSVLGGDGFFASFNGTLDGLITLK